MQFITDFIDWITSTFQSIWDFFTGFIDSILMLFDYLGIVADLCYNLIGSMPSWLQVFGTITILISVLYIVLGRQTGGQKE